MKRWERHLDWRKRQFPKLAIAFVASVVHAPSASTFTTTSIDTSGATLLVAQVVWFNGGPEPTLTDSKNGSTGWAALTTQTNSTLSTRLYYNAGGSVGTGHTFTLTASNFFGSCCVSSYSGTSTSSPLDQQAGSNSAIQTLSPGSITPSQDGEIVICGSGYTAGASEIINGGFTIRNQGAADGNGYAALIADLIQTTAAAANPQITYNAACLNGGTNASFKAAAAAGGSLFLNQGELNGLGSGGPFFRNPIG